MTNVPPSFSFSHIPDHFLFPEPSQEQVSSFQRTLRRSGLDELPQLILLLNGTMSLVGPRPEMVQLAKCYTVSHQERLAVKPGLTGLAQVCGRERLKYRHKIRYDLFYIQKQSFRLDCWILWKSLKLCLDAFRRKDL